jgi:hypothetical protein
MLDGTVTTQRVHCMPLIMATFFRRLPIGLIAAACVMSGQAMAELSLSSASSDSISTSIGASSTSIGRSSESSRRDHVAEGDYTVVEVADATDRPGLVRLTLRLAAPSAGAAVAGGADETFDLYVPQANPAARLLVQGQTIRARQRPYGVEFAHGEPQQAFFLVLQDAWFQELHSQPVRL